MARMRNKVCERCGYHTHKTYELGPWGWYEVCPDCTLEIILANEEDWEAMLEHLPEGEDV